MDQLATHLESLLSSGSIGAIALSIALAYLGGVLSSLTPCIYPMIPITVGVVGGIRGKHEKRSARDVLIRGLAYVLGMAIIYAFLGVMAGITGKIFGTLTNSSSWYISLGVIMTIAALMMMDVFSFDPQVWLERFKRKLGFKHTPKINSEKEATLLGAFLLGASSGFIAAPCTTPALTAILGYIAQTQSVILGLALMLSFSFGLGTILLLIAAFAGKLNSLPKAGEWMSAIKKLSGVIILIFAQYLIYKAGKSQ